MLRNICKPIGSAIQLQDTILKVRNIAEQQLRTTFILKRKHEPLLHKKGLPFKKLKSKHYIYELIKDTAIEGKPDINIILTQYVEGFGNAGDKLSVRPGFAYNKLLLPGLAVYASPENIEKYENYKSGENEIKYSSPYVHRTMQQLSNIVLSVVMSKDNAWTLKPWHVHVSFRKCGYTVPEETITLPEQPITGPDLNLQDREFCITVTINKTEKVQVRCRIHHWSTEITDRIVHVHEFWKETPGPVFPEDAEIIENMRKKAEEKNTN